MGLIARDSGGGNYELAPEGTHAARCFAVIDLGQQHSAYYNSISPKVLVGWELVDERTTEGEPFVVWKRYTNSLNEKAAIRKDLQAWRAKAFTPDELKGFALTNIIGAPCLLSVVHTKSSDGTKTYANVASVSPPMRGQEIGPMKSARIVFDVDSPDWDVFNDFGKNLQETIRNSVEWKSRGVVGPSLHETTEDTTNGADDDIPF